MTPSSSDAVVAGHVTASRIDPVLAGRVLQPEVDGSRQCLECGRWYRDLGAHMKNTHRLHMNDYRQRHGIPPTPQQLAAAEFGRRRRRRLDDRYEARARDLGYADLAAVLEATKNLTAAGLGELLGVSKQAAWGLRRRHGVDSPGFQAIDRKRPTVRRTPDPYRTPPDLRPKVPLGVQPEEANRVQCLDCGRWYRLLGNHLRQAHGITVAEYQAEFELPASRGLVPEDLREQMAARARQRLDTDERLRAALTNDAATLAERRKLSVRAREENKHRAGVRRAWQESAWDASKKRSKNLRTRLDQRARKLGYADIVHLLTGTTHLTAAQLGELLGASTTEATKLRARHDIRSRAREHQAAERQRARNRALRPPKVPPGVQPRDGDRLQCLECGRWYRSLGQHIGSHGIDAAEYRRRHGLAIRHPLAADDIREASAERFKRRLDADPQMRRMQQDAVARLQQHRAKTAAATRESAQRAEVRRTLQESIARAALERSRRRRERYDQRARELGYADLYDLLYGTQSMLQRELAEVLGVSNSQIGRLRSQLFRRRNDA